MGIVIKDGFKFLDGLNSEYILVESEKLEECIEYINCHEISSIALNDTFYTFEEIDFLEYCPKVKKVNILGSFLKSYDGLERLYQLQELYIGDPKTKVDVSQFSQLERLYVDMNKNIVGLANCNNLKVLKLWNYKPRCMNLEELSGLAKLEELDLVQSSVTELTGVESFPLLSKLGLYYCNKLTTIKQILEVKKNILELSVEACKHVTDFNVLSGLKKLEKLLITDSGSISSMKFIEELPQLKSFVFMGTTIEDGDLSSCYGLEYVAFTDKKYYSHKMKEFNKK